MTHEAETMFGVTSKRFGLFEADSKGQPERNEGRFNNFNELMAKCQASPERNYVVEIARYAFVNLDEFKALFGPISYQPSRLP
jgi:hypothetical protein